MMRIFAKVAAAAALSTVLFAAPAALHLGKELLFADGSWAGSAVIRHELASCFSALCIGYHKKRKKAPSETLGVCHEEASAHA